MASTTEQHLAFERSVRARAPDWLRLAGVFGGVVVSFVSLCGCAPAPVRPPNVVLIVVDTLRWDRLGAYGADRATSPRVDALAAQSIRFERAYATAPWTRPSIGSMLTGLLPSAHGGWAANRPLPDQAVTLAEMLSGGGYATAGVISNFVIARAKGFAQGFEHFDQSQIGSFEKVSTEKVTDRAIAAGQAMRGDAGGAAGRPFFLFVHYQDPHYRYQAHDDVDFAPERVGRLDGSQSMNRLRKMKSQLSDSEIAYLRDLYDEEIRHTDAGVGRLLDWLTANRLDEETIVVFTSDHGEEFLEHGRLGHTASLYEELIRVPLLLRIPGEPPRVVRRPVSLVAIVPTLLDLVGLAPPPDVAFRARSLLSEPSESLAHDDDGRLAVEDFLFSEVDFESPLEKHKNAALKAIVGERYKLILDERIGRLELYDLQRDPLERRDLAAREPARVARLEAILREHIRASRQGAIPTRAEALGPEEIEMLRGLGYIED